LLELAKTLAVVSAPRRVSARGRGENAGERGLAIMTCSGGDSAQGADEAERLGVELPELAPATCDRLRDLLPEAATAANPLDYTAMIWGDAPALSGLVQTLGADPAIDRVLVFYDQPADLDGAVKESWDAVREGVIAGAAASEADTIVSSTLPELLDDEAAWRFIQVGIPAVAGLRTGLRCAAAVAQPVGDPGRLREIGAAARAVGATGSAGAWVSEFEAKGLLRAARVSVVDGRLVEDEDDAALALAEFGGNVAVKLNDASVQHKSEMGAVCLGVQDETAVRTAYRRFSELGAGVLVERMAAPGVELIIAARTDAIVPALVIGLGGIWTEVLDDVAVVPLPAGAERIERALRSLRGAPLLTGGRGGAPLDLGAAARLAQRVGELLIEDSLELIELNPVLVNEEGAVAADAAARLRVSVVAPSVELSNDPATPAPAGAIP
jgi:acetate---CoA ligase (ADP-forming)